MNKLPYFGELEEQAVINFNNSDSLEERNIIYEKVLMRPFKKMIQCIFRKYFIYLKKYDNKLESDAMTHLIDKMSNFNSNKINKNGNKTKAYSYCQTIVKNYFIEYSKKIQIDKKKLNFDDFEEYFDDSENYSCEMNSDQINDNSLELLFSEIIIKINEKLNNEKCSLTKKDIIVGESIVNILTNWKISFIDDEDIHKKNILSLLRSYTKLSTVEIRHSISKKFNDIYLFEKNIFKF